MRSKASIGTPWGTIPPWYPRMPKPEGIPNESRSLPLPKFVGICNPHTSFQPNREFATPIVARRQNIASKTNVFQLRITCFFQRWELQIPDFSLSQITNSAEQCPFGSKRTGFEDWYVIMVKIILYHKMFSWILKIGTQMVFSIVGQDLHLLD